MFIEIDIDGNPTVVNTDDVLDLPDGTPVNKIIAPTIDDVSLVGNTIYICGWPVGNITLKHNDITVKNLINKVFNG